MPRAKKETVPDKPKKTITKKRVNRAKKLVTLDNSVIPSIHDEVRLPEISKVTLNWLDAEKRALIAEARTKQFALDSLLKKIDPGGAVLRTQDEIRSMITKAQEMGNQYVEESKKAASELGLDTGSQWSFDDVTGVVHILEQEKVPTTEGPK